MRAYRARRREVLTDVEAAWTHVMDADRAFERAEAENYRLQATVEDLRSRLRIADREVKELRRAIGNGAAGGHRANEPGPPVGLNRAARRRMDRARRSELRG